MRQRWNSARTPAHAFRLLAIVSAALGLGIGVAGPASAATFTVDPTQIFLRNRTSSVLLTIHNQSTDTLSFQLSAFGWTQSSTGEMQLEPTQDVVFFPPLLTLKPSETRRVRVGTATVFDAKEKTYRIFVEELPPADAPKGVRVLTKMGIPIFLRPAKEVATASLTDLHQQEGQLKFTLSNEGTVHFIPRNIRVRGLVGPATAFERELEGWYLLAGGRRDFQTPLPKDGCAQVTSIVVDVRFESSQVQERLQTPNGACAR